MTVANMDVDSLLLLGQQFLSAGNGDEAEKTYREILKQNPRHAEALFNLAFVVYRKGKVEDAIDLFRRAVLTKPGYKEAHYNLGIVLQNAGRLQEAGQSFAQALQIDTRYFEAYIGMGSLMRDARLFDKALEFYNAAISINPTPDAHTHIGYVYQLKNMPNEAGAHYKQALAQKPDHLGALNNLGTLYSQINKYEEAQALYETALAHHPRDLHAINNLGRIYHSTGMTEKAIETYRKGLEIQPGRVPLRNNIMMSMVYAPNVAPEDLMKEAQDFGRIVADPLLRIRPFINDKDPDRRLRIGYVSGDFRSHAASFFIEPLVRNHDREKFEIYAYANVAKEDDVTTRMKEEFDHWRDIRNRTDDDAANMIEEDKIDILVDVSGHTEGNRLLVFARKPAPVQATWLGFPATTGMKAIDYRITDNYADPEGMTEKLNAETLWRLPQIFCCYGVPVNSPDVIDHPPFEDNGYITFGCFNNFSKVTDEVLAVWQKVMMRVPEARLLLEISGLDQQKFRAEVDARLQRAGMPVDRIILEPRKPENQYVLYNKIDIALDPFPCNGGTTSMDTLWMGVPIVTLAGKHFVSRMGVSILSNAGLPEFITQTTDEYIDKAVGLANNKEKLRQVRQGLRDKVQASALMDIESFAKNVEDAYRGMWRKWCERA